MKGVELLTLVCVRCLLGVEKVGRDWVVNEAKEVGEARERAVGWREEEIWGFDGDNMKKCSTKLARE